MEKEKERGGTNAMSKLTDSSVEVAEADAWRARKSERKKTDTTITPSH
jgi:hypothetical protein